MKTTLLALTILVFTGLTQCKHQKEANSITNEEVKVDIPEPQKPAIPMVIDRAYRPQETTPYEILSSDLDGDILTLIVSFSVGCEVHEFSLISNQMYMKSMPLQLPLYLEHDSHGDACRALIQETLQFDISSARYTGSKVVRLLVNGSRENEVLYEYPNKN